MGWVTLRRSAPLLLSLAAVGCGAEQAANTPARAAATCKATSAETEGPYYKSGPPKRKTFVKKHTKGRRLIVSGRVRDTSCHAVAGARVDFWPGWVNAVPRLPFRVDVAIEAPASASPAATPSAAAS